MIVVEVLVAILVAVVVVVGLMKVAGPIADAFADRLKMKFQEIGPEQEREFRSRIDSLEQEVRDLKREMQDMRESMTFAVKIDNSEKVRRD